MLTGNIPRDQFLVLIRIRILMKEHFLTFLNTGRYDFLTIYCHSSGGDAAAALTYKTGRQHVRPWRSLLSLTALVYLFICLFLRRVKHRTNQFVLQIT